MNIISSSPPVVIRDRYFLVSWLAKGSQGLTFLGRDDRLARSVVVKFLGTPETDPHHHLLQQAQQMSSFAHPHIAGPLDMGVEDGWFYLVVEHFPGGNLAQLRDHAGGRLPVGQALSLARQVLDALAYTQAQGILHGALKPQNILLTITGEVKVVDFTLEQINTGSLAPTPYTAPELLQGAPKDPCTDLYALGVILYEQLAGHAPHLQANNGAVLAGQPEAASVVPPSNFNPEISPALDAFILRLLANHRAGRFQDAYQALHELDQVIAVPLRAMQTGLPLPPAVDVDDARRIEMERRHFAENLHSRVVEPLNLLLAQTGAYEQSLSSQPQIRMAFSVLSALTRQVLQQARDLETSMRPLVLETLGLEPALEILAEQVARIHGLSLVLDLERFSSRFPPAFEQVMFRWVQAVIALLVDARITSARIHLTTARPDHAAAPVLRCVLSAAASARLRESPPAGLEGMLAALGGRAHQAFSASGEVTWTASLPLPTAAAYTLREQQVLQGLVEGLSNKQIAARLSISPRTVNYHLDNIFSRLGVRTRTEAALLAVRQGLVPSSGGSQKSM